MSLTIGRKSGQGIWVGESLITVEGKGKIKVKIDAAKSVPIRRAELPERKRVA